MSYWSRDDDNNDDNPTTTRGIVSFNFVVTGKDKQPSVERFDQLTSSRLVLENLLEKCKYEHPTPIQKHGSPQLLAGMDVICCAPKCSGKTAAFLIPIISNLFNIQETLVQSYSLLPVKPEALILAPTRELAIQIGKEANMYADGTPIKTAVAYGGIKFGSTVSQLKRGVNILVGTTGRLKHLIKENCLDLCNVKYFIIDEADCMLNKSFIQDVEEIVKKLPPKEERVTGMFSSTFIQMSQSQFIMDDYIYVVIATVGRHNCVDGNKQELLLDDVETKKINKILEDLDKDVKTLVFCNTEESSYVLAYQLIAKHISCISLHGYRLEGQRQQDLHNFVNGNNKVMIVSTDAARGLDIPKVGLVVNYDIPTDMIGCTGIIFQNSISIYHNDNDIALVGKMVSSLKRC